MNSENTAMHIETPSNATRKLVEELKKAYSIPTVMDYGAGNGRNANFMRKETFAYVLAYDPYPHRSPLYPIFTKSDGFKDIKFDYVLCSFVANTLPRTPREILFEALAKLNYQNLIIEVRSIADVQKIKKRTRYSDGYNTSRGTFQKGFEPADINRMNDFFGEHGMIFTKTHHALSFIWRKEL